MTNKVTLDVKAPGVKQIAGDVSDLQGRFTKLRTEGSKGFGVGVGAAITTTALNLVGAAASSAAGFIGDASQAYREDQVSVTQLGAALRANIRDWDGNTSAIEKTISARMRLGFTDEDQRATLTKLVGAYHDVTKALDVQRHAMDLARYSGISLEAASQILINVQAGNYRSLRSLGIATKDIKNSTQALGLVYEKVGGQAAAYAETDLGKVEAANIRLGESQERLGKVFSQFGAEILPHVADGAESLQTSLGAVGDLMAGRITPESAALARILGLVTDKQLAAGLAAMRHQDALRFMADAAKDDLAPALNDVTDAASENSDEMEKLRSEYLKTRAAANDLSDELRNLEGAMFDGAILAGDIADAQQRLQDLLTEAPKKGTAEWVIWNGKVAEAKKRLFELQYQQMQSAGPAALQAWLLKQRAAIDTADTAALAYIDTLLRLNGIIAGISRQADLTKDDLFRPPSGSSTKPSTTTTKPTTGGGTVGGRTALAAGGPVAEGRPYTVGESGPELFVPDSAGTIVPNGGGTTILNLTFNGNVGDRKEDVVLALQRAAAFVR